ncbi:MAG: hypothetical protein WAM52_11230 [Steroidobacteraceae bacterium]
MTLFRALACVLVGIFSGGMQAQAGATGASAKLQSLVAHINHAYASSDWKSYRAGSVVLVRFLNGSPDAMLELAKADARTGDSRAALRQLRAIAQMGVSQPKIATLSDLAALRGRPEFQRVLRDMTANARPLSHSSRALAIADANLQPEDVAYDSGDGEFLLTSVREAKIVAVAISGRMSTFARSPDGWPMLAIRIDSGHRVLWATEVALTGLRSVPRHDWGRSVILEFDLGTARLLRRIEGPRGSQLGDMTLSPGGNLLVCDSNNGGLYLVRRGGSHLVRLPINEFVSPMTPVFVSSDRVFVADYVRGIALLDLGAGRVTWLPMENKYALAGTDGLYWHQNRLIAIQNGFAPERIVSFTLDRARTRIAAETIIESGTPDLDPTHAVIVADALYYIENSGWNEVTGDGSVRGGASLTPAAIKRVRL